MDQKVYDIGMKMRRKVAGDSYVDKAMAGMDDFNRDFQRIVTQYCWGEAWGDETLPPRERSILNLGMIASLGRMEEFQTHVRGALNNGMTPNEIRAVLTQIAIYCGIPVGVDCFRHARPIIAEWQCSTSPTSAGPRTNPPGRRSIYSSISPSWKPQGWWCASTGRSTRTPSCIRWCAGSSRADCRKTSAARSCSPT
jgi:4-carboxymuconolactone decarboxylase